MLPLFVWLIWLARDQSSTQRTDSGWSLVSGVEHFVWATLRSLPTINLDHWLAFHRSSRQRLKGWMVRKLSSPELTASQRLGARCVVWLLQVRSARVSSRASSTNTCWWSLLPLGTSRQVLHIVLFEPILLKLRLLSPFGIYQCMVTFPSWTHSQ